MKSYTEYLTMNIPARMAFEHITPEVEEALRKERHRGGNCPDKCDAYNRIRVHQRRRAGPARGLQEVAGGLTPFDPSPVRYKHNRTGEDNADAHMKRQVMGREVVVAVTKGKLDFGPWEQIFYGEFDGNRPKRVLVKVIGE